MGLFSTRREKLELKKRLGEKPWVSAVVVAAGRGERMGAEVSKQLLPLCGVPIIARALSAFEGCVTVDEVVVVTRPEDLVLVADIVREYGFSKVVRIVHGGGTRQLSVKLGFEAVNEKAAFIAVHDGARPLVTPECIDRVVLRAFEKKAVTAAVRLKDTVKLADENGVVVSTPERSKLWIVQTPQVFEKDLYRAAFERAEAEGRSFTDDCQLIEHLGKSVQLVEGEYTNIKITTADDLPIAETILRARGDGF